MIKNKKNNLNKYSVKGRILILCLLIFIFFILVFQITSKGYIYNFTSGFAKTNENNLILYDYEVYANETKFEKAKNRISEVVDRLKEKGETVLVRLPSKKNGITRNGDYVIKYDNTAIELNIEYYVVKNMKIFGYDIPCKTFISIFDKTFLTVYVMASEIILCIIITIIKNLFHFYCVSFFNVVK